MGLVDASGALAGSVAIRNETVSITGELIILRAQKKILTPDKMAETVYLEINESLEKPKRKMNEAQLASLAKGRAKKLEVDAQAKETKTNAKLEARFDKLVAMFEQVRMPPVEVQQAIKKKGRIGRRARGPCGETETGAGTC